MKKILLFILFIFPVFVFAQSPAGVSFIKGATQTNQMDTLSFTYPGSVGGAKTLAPMEFIRSLFELKTGNDFIRTVSVASANGFGGTSSGGATPALTLSTSINGLLKGNGTAISAATAGTDYVIPSGSITGTATNITAASNSTLTTISALSLPYSQITGTPSLTGYQTIANLETTLTNSTTQYPSGSAVTAQLAIVTSNFVPYSSAIGPVNLGAYGITANIFNSISGTSTSFISGATIGQTNTVGVGSFGYLNSGQLVYQYNYNSTPVNSFFLNTAQSSGANNIITGNPVDVQTGLLLSTLPPNSQLMTGNGGLLTTQPEIVHQSVDYATTSALPANTYNNGTAGVGATLTGNANGALTVDGNVVAITSPLQRILVYQEATAANNGIYSVTQAGDASHPYILTRGSYSSVAGNLASGMQVYVSSGTQYTGNLGLTFQQITSGTVTIGTTPLVFRPLTLNYISNNTPMARDALQVAGKLRSVTSKVGMMKNGTPVTVNFLPIGDSIAGDIFSATFTNALKQSYGPFTSWHGGGNQVGSNYTLGGSTTIVGMPTILSSLTSSGTTATATTASPHGLITGQTVAISGANNLVYNVSAVVTVTSSTTFTYTIASSTTSPDPSPNIYFTLAADYTKFISGSFINIPSGSYYEYDKQRTDYGYSSGFTQFKIYYISQVGGGTFSVSTSTDGITYTNVAGYTAVNTTDTQNNLQILTIPNPSSPTAIYIKVTSTSGTVQLAGVGYENLMGSKVSSLLAVGGTTLVNYALCPARIWAAYLKDFQPDVITEYFADDATPAYSTALSTVQGYFSTYCPNAAVIYPSPYAGYQDDPVYTGTPPTYTSAMQGAAIKAFLASDPNTTEKYPWDASKYIGTWSSSSAMGMHDSSGPVNISSLSISGTTITVTTATPHNIVSGNFVRIIGALPNEYNGLYLTCVVTSSTSFTVTANTLPTTTGSGGNAAAVDGIHLQENGRMVLGMAFMRDFPILNGYASSYPFTLGTALTTAKLTTLTANAPLFLDANKSFTNTPGSDLNLGGFNIITSGGANVFNGINGAVTVANSTTGQRAYYQAKDHDGNVVMNIGSYNTADVGFLSNGTTTIMSWGIGSNPAVTFGSTALTTFTGNIIAPTVTGTTVSGTTSISSPSITATSTFASQRVHDNGSIVALGATSPTNTYGISFNNNSGFTFDHARIQQNSNGTSGGSGGFMMDMSGNLNFANGLWSADNNFSPGNVVALTGKNATGFVINSGGATLGNPTGLSFYKVNTTSNSVESFFYLNTNKNVGVHIETPSAQVQLAGQSTAAGSAPLKFTYITPTVTGASGTGTIVTLTFAQQYTGNATTPFAIGSTITVAGIAPSGYNATAVVTACTTTSVSYANTTTSTYTSGGTITTGLMATPENGAVEYDGTNFYATNSTGVRGTIAMVGTTPQVQSANRVTAQTAAATLPSYTVGAADGTFIVSANILVTTSTVHSFSATCTYTDESNTSRVLTLNFSQLTGAFVTAITNGTGASAYEGVPVHIRCKAATTIQFATTGTFTGVTYNFGGVIQQVN